MDVTNIPLILENYEDISVEAARRAEWIAVRLRHFGLCAPVYTETGLFAPGR